MGPVANNRKPHKMQREKGSFHITNLSVYLEKDFVVPKQNIQIDSAWLQHAIDVEMKKTKPNQLIGPKTIK